MELTGQELEQLQQALLKAYDPSSLKQMLRFKLEKDLDVITSANGFNNIVFDLITFANKEGWLIQLITSAKDYNYDNQLLNNTANSLLSKLLNDIPTGFQDNINPSTSGKGKKCYLEDKLNKNDDKDFITDVFEKYFLEFVNDFANSHLIENNLKNTENNLNPNFLNKAAQKYKKKIEDQYNVVKVLGMSKPKTLSEVYTSINVFEDISSYKPITDKELEQYSQTKRTNENGVKIVNKFERLILVGKPGSGKTTFLKYIALQAIQGKLNQQLIPIFITLKNLLKKNESLQQFIINQFDVCGFQNDYKLFVEWLLLQGKCLVLFDGLDEVDEEREDELIKEIRAFSNKPNRIVLTYRIGTNHYNFEQFTEVEIDDFDDKQIKTFIAGWFGTNTEKINICLEKLHKEDMRVKGLVSIPLLLTLLCIAFESSDEIISLPKNRAELYKDAVDRISRTQGKKLYAYLNLESMLSKIAYVTFKQGQRSLSENILEGLISDFVSHSVNTDEKNTLVINSKKILSFIQSQHGIFVKRAKGLYSFFHPIFQEYFTAKYIIDQPTDQLDKIINDHFMDDKWQEIFLLIPSMLKVKDNFFLSINKKTTSLLSNTLAKYLRIVSANIQLQLIIDDTTNTIKLPASLLYAIKYYITVDWFFSHAFDRDIIDAFYYNRNVICNLIHNLASVYQVNIDSLTDIINLACNYVRKLDSDTDLDNCLDLNHGLNMDYILDQFELNKHDSTLELIIFLNYIINQPELSELVEQANLYFSSKLRLITFLKMANCTEETICHKILEDIFR